MAWKIISLVQVGGEGEGEGEVEAAQPSFEINWVPREQSTSDICVLIDWLR